MISANDLRNVKLTSAENGYNVEEVNIVIDKAASTIEAYANENKELYHKMEVLASKIEEYREEENSIKTALITAQKMADRIKKDATDESDALLKSSKETAETTISDANANADKIVSEARQYATDMIKEKSQEAEAIITDAEKKSNEAINSSKIVAKNILDQAKEISEDLITKSKEEKEAYDILIASLKQDAAAFIGELKDLYSAQLDKLNSAKIDTETESKDDEVTSIHTEVDSLVSEMEEMQEAIPDEITIEKKTYTAPIAEEEETEEETVAVSDDGDDEIEILDEDVEAPEYEDETEDPMAAVEAFSQNEITPIDTSRRVIPEIDEEPQMEKSLFDEEEKRPFENYFNVNKRDAHGDKTQTISLVPPEDDAEDDEPKFKGFFKKKR